MSDGYPDEDLCGQTVEAVSDGGPSSPANEEGWRDVTPATQGFEFEVQMHADGRARHRVKTMILMCAPAADIIPAGEWNPGWPGKGLQW